MNRNVCKSKSCFHTPLRSSEIAKVTSIGEFKAQLRVRIVFHLTIRVDLAGVHLDGVAAHLSGVVISPEPRFASRIGACIHTHKTVVIEVIRAAGGGTRIGDGREAAEVLESRLDVEPETRAQADVIRRWFGAWVKEERL